MYNNRNENILFKTKNNQLISDFNTLNEHDIMLFLESVLNAFKNRDSINSLDVLTELQMYLKQYSNENDWSSFHEMLEHFSSRPLQDILKVDIADFNSEPLKDLLSSTCLRKEDYFITQNAHVFLSENHTKTYQDLRDAQQNAFMKLIARYPDHNKNELYNLLRSFIITGNTTFSYKINPYIQEKDFIELEKKATAIASEDTRSLIKSFKKELFQKVSVNSHMRVCSSCGKFTTNYYESDSCLDSDFCSYLYLKEKARKEAAEKVRGQIFILKDGVHRYIRIPGLEEIRIYNKLKDKLKGNLSYKVVLYPGMESLGDVGIYETNTNTLLLSIDLKDYATPSALVRKYSKEKENQTFKSHVLYLPDYRIKTKGYVEYLRNSKAFKNVKIYGWLDLAKEVERKINSDKEFSV